MILTYYIRHSTDLYEVIHRDNHILHILRYTDGRNRGDEVSFDDLCAVVKEKVASEMKTEDCSFEI